LHWGQFMIMAAPAYKQTLDLCSYQA